IFDRAQTSARHIRERIERDIDVAVVLGSGLGAFAETLEDKVGIAYDEIRDVERSTVEGHSGRLVVGKLPSTAVNVAVMQGRFHYYEGYSMEEVTLPIRAFGAMGLKKLALTNAAGAVNPEFKQGDFMLIGDHINLMMISPLRGKHDKRLGERFPDMTEAYSRAYRRVAQEAAAEIGIDLREGVYLALHGPNYETPAKIQLIGALGA